MFYCADIKWVDNGDISTVRFSEYDNEPLDTDPFTDDEIFFYGISRDTAIADTGKKTGNEFIFLSVGDYE